LVDDYLQGVNDERERIRDGVNKILEHWDKNLSAEAVDLIIRIDGVVEGE
jgi:hypothetical protein